MDDSLKELIERGRTVQMSDDAREEQRRSFAYGTANIENADVTRETIRVAAEDLKRVEDASSVRR